MNANTIKKLSVAALLVFAVAAPVGAQAGPDEAAKEYESMVDKPMSPSETIDAYGKLLDAAGSDSSGSGNEPSGADGKP